MVKKVTKKETEEERITPDPETKPEETKAIKEDTKKHSWLAFEAPDKNGKKIKVHQGKAKRMKEKLMEQPEVSTFIPRNDGEAKSIPQIVNLNGYKLNIPKGAYVSLPRQIHDVIRASHQQVENAYAEINDALGLDRDTRSVEALN